jgi:hypothetical protein
MKVCDATGLDRKSGKPRDLQFATKSRSSAVMLTKRGLVIPANFLHFAFRRWWRKPNKTNREDATSDTSNSLSAKNRIIVLPSLKIGKNQSC